MKRSREKREDLGFQAKAATQGPRSLQRRPPLPSPPASSLARASLQNSHVQSSGLPGRKECCRLPTFSPLKADNGDGVCSRPSVQRERNSSAPVMRLRCAYDPGQEDSLKSNKDEGRGSCSVLARPIASPSPPSAGSAPDQPPTEGKQAAILTLSVKSNKTVTPQNALDSPFSRAFL